MQYAGSFRSGNGVRMDGARLSRFPYCSWIGTPFRAPPSEDERAFHLHAVVHALHLTIRGTHATRWIHQGREVRWQAHAGQVHFLPADDLDHELLAHSPAGYESFLLFLPRRHVQAIARVEGIRSEIHPQRLLREDDRLLQTCLLRLAAATTAAGGGPDGSQPVNLPREITAAVPWAGSGG